MEQSLRMMNIVRWALAASVALYFALAEQVKRSAASSAASPQPTFLYALALVAGLSLLMAGLVRKKIAGDANEVLRNNQDEPKALMRWRTGNLIFLAVCESVALYGLTLRLLGAATSQVALFFLAALTGMLFFGPRRP